MTRARSGLPAWVKLLSVIVIAALAIVAGIAIGQYFDGNGERDTTATVFVQPEDDVILASAGVAEIREEKSDPKLWGLVDVPGNERAKYIRYEFTVKLGIDGGKVKIEPVGDDYRIQIPEFVALGVSDVDIEVAVESNGPLSWATPEIEEIDMFENAIAEENLEKQIDKNRDLLQRQAEVFYSNIILSVEPNANLRFEFAGGRDESAK